MVLVALLVLGFVYRKPLESWILRRADEGQNPSGSYGESKGECSRRASTVLLAGDAEARDST
jgi:hypothetical protein